MSKIKKVINRTIIALILMVGILNIADYIYAGTAANAATSGTGTFTPSVIINPTATIDITGGDAKLSVTPNKDGLFAYTTAPITVSVYTNTTNQVKVNMKAAGTTLVSGSNTIPTLTANSTTANFPANYWGYNTATSKTAPTSYKPVATSNEINTLTSKTGGTANTTYVYFGMKVNAATPPGDYTRALTFETVVTQ